MLYSDEKDYVMRMIKEMVRLLASLLLGKQYVRVELPRENKYNVSGKTPDDYKAMVDRGEINEAENILLDGLDYAGREELAAAVRFYQYVGDKGEEFLRQNNYSEEEVLEGLTQLAKRAGYGEVCEML